MDKRKIKTVISRVRKFKRAVSKKFFIEKIIIFGSASSGRMTEHSDIDIITVSNKYGRKHIFKIAPKLYKEWHKIINCPVDILLFNTQEFNKLRKKVSIVSEALKSGIEV